MFYSIYKLLITINCIMNQDFDHYASVDTNFNCTPLHCSRKGQNQVNSEVFETLFGSNSFVRYSN